MAQAQNPSTVIQPANETLSAVCPCHHRLRDRKASGMLLKTFNRKQFGSNRILGWAQTLCKYSEVEHEISRVGQRVFPNGIHLNLGRKVALLEPRFLER
jgi:hypothetical protein